MELYTISPKNSVSITIIESVSSNGTTITLVIIILGKMYIESWYYENLHRNELMLLLDSGYINNKLTMLWLNHFIKETKSNRLLD
jgi:hypothetical protein